MISMIWKLHSPLLGRKRRMWRRLSMKKLNSFVICFAKSWLVSVTIWKKSIATLSGQCFEFPATGANVGDMLDWFRTEVQALHTTFAESNQNITCYAVVGILRMLVGVECGHLSELRRSAISCDASLLHDIPEDLGKIDGRLVQNWWTQHGLPYCMQWLEEDNRVSFILIAFIA
jgi:hypothetical protein